MQSTMLRSMPLKSLYIGAAIFLLLLVGGGQLDAAGDTEYLAIITYRVQPGDTLWLLSINFDTTVAQLRADNPHAKPLQPGQVLYITTRVSGGTFPYRVRPGESLYLISRRTQRSIEAIRRASGLTNSVIRAADMLRIPVCDDGEYAEWVRPGDTLETLARRHEVTAAHLRSLNPLAADQIRVNQILRIPAGAVTPPVAQPGDNLLAYRVHAGDTLNAVAARFRTTARAVSETNHLRSDLLMPGQLLYIPVGSRSPQVVQGPRGSQVSGYGELLTWELARWYYPPGTDATITDLYTGQRFSVRRLGGSNHADSEPVTARDTAVMYGLFGNTWTWASRPVLLEVRGRTFAASMASMPHDVQTIYNNNFDGHFCLYFYNSRSHNTNSIQGHHQDNVLRAAGLR